MAEIYLPVVLAVLVGVGFATGMLLLKTLLGPRRATPVKLEPFECGVPSIGTPRVRFSVKFYQVAILFLVFDIEAAFFYPWAVLHRELGARGLLAVAVFLVVLLVALAYVWRKGALDWGPEAG